MQKKATLTYKQAHEYKTEILMELNNHPIVPDEMLK